MTRRTGWAVRSAMVERDNPELFRKRAERCESIFNTIDDFIDRMHP